ncbi:COX15/CtaA family protein [Acaricomes phytoseiuli]|uniref:COX15/CtaA family protein n=1 Tax=Acaricomes phytoseiuli TaxID=291968 RepID=UPI002222F2CA|nr:COX15/CtaA family protein [Acaricomes phytoseiuli]MCW1250314.1 COX15/CtaA family protein [Acaricomes phytoseiuli]
MRETLRSFGQNIARRLPTQLNATIRRLAVASLIGQITIILTGGAVRLTASGLGCPTWPKCTPESLVNTPEMGIHGFIEFGNRTLTIVLALIALAMLVALWNFRHEQRTMFWLAIGLLASIPAQAVVGGITVLTKLNPWVVGVHFLISATLVVFATLLVNRAFARPPREMRPASPIIRQLALASSILVGITVIIGVMVTGSGPHAGDPEAPRNGLEPDLITRIHVLPVYLLVISAVLLAVLAWRRGSGDLLRRGSLLQVAAVFAQGLIGYVQNATGLPILLVGMHLLGSALLLAATTNMTDLAFRSGKDPATPSAKPQLEESGTASG